MNHYGYKKAIAALALFGTLSMLSVPSLRAMHAQNQQAAAMEALVSSLALARRTATGLRSPVHLCPIGDEGATPQCTTGLRWDRGWIVYADTDRNGRLAPDAPACTSFEPGRDCIAHTEAFATTQAAVRIDAPREIFKFLPGGYRTQVGHFTVCGTANIVPRRISVSATGRVGFRARARARDCRN